MVLNSIRESNIKKNPKKTAILTNKDRKER